MHAATNAQAGAEKLGLKAPANPKNLQLKKCGPDGIQVCGSEAVRAREGMRGTWWSWVEASISNRAPPPDAVNLGMWR